MALESATYIDALNTAWPDGGDQRSTADDHLRLVKAALKRTFSKVAGDVSASHGLLNRTVYLGDLSASVQAQLNLLRDGSATVVHSLYANSASYAGIAATANSASYAALAGLADTANSASYAALAGNANYANSASYAAFAGALVGGGGGSGTSYVHYAASAEQFSAGAITSETSFNAIVIPADTLSIGDYVEIDFHGTYSLSGSLTDTVFFQPVFRGPDWTESNGLGTAEAAPGVNTLGSNSVRPYMGRLRGRVMNGTNSAIIRSWLEVTVHKDAVNFPSGTDATPAQAVKAGDVSLGTVAGDIADAMTFYLSVSGLTEVVSIGKTMTHLKVVRG